VGPNGKTVRLATPVFPPSREGAKRKEKRRMKKKTVKKFKCSGCKHGTLIDDGRYMWCEHFDAEISYPYYMAGCKFFKERGKESKERS